MTPPQWSASDMVLGLLLLTCLCFTMDGGVQASYSPDKIPLEAHFAETFDSGPLDRKWVLSKAMKQTDTEALKYDGQWALEDPEAELHPGNRALVMKSPGKHHAISAYLHTPFTHTHTPLCLQYEVRFGKGVECSGAYIKLLTQTHQLRLGQFSESTPYSVMFGPDKCGKIHQLHLIVRVTDPSNGGYRETHAPQPVDDLASYFTDRQSHLYTLHLYADSRYEIFIDQALVSHGQLLTNELPITGSPERQQQLSEFRVESVGALGLELWSLSGEVIFDNILLTDDLKLAERWTQNTWGQKQPGRLERLFIVTSSRPWLWGVYVFTIGLPLILFISYMWPDKRFGPADQDYYYKKNDDPQPDSQSETEQQNGQTETDQPGVLSSSPTRLAGYGALSRARAWRREAQRKSDLEMKTEGQCPTRQKTN